MNIKDESNFNSLMLDKLYKDIEALKKRVNETNERISGQSYGIHENAKMLAEILKMTKVNKEMLDVLNIEVYTKRNALDVIADRFTNTKTLIILSIAFVVFEAYSLTPMIFKHLLGW